MKALSLIFIALCLLLAGCESTGSSSGSLKDRWNARSAGRNCVFEADARAVHSAAVAAAKSMGFRITKAGSAQGIMEAVGDRTSDSSLRGSRQVAMKVRIAYAAEGSELRLFLSEIIEDDFNKGAGRGTESPLENTPLYEVFFRAVQANLKVQK